MKINYLCCIRRNHTIGTTTDQGTVNFFLYYTSGAAVSVVEVDCLTGDHEVYRVFHIFYIKQVITIVFFFLRIRF